jgi:hypothetical protein
MPLTWDVRDIADHERVTSAPWDSNKWHPVTDSLVWLSLNCGFSSITEKNVEEAAARIWLAQSLLGAFQTVGGRSVLLTLDDVRMHRGFRSNVSDLTWPQFMKKYREALLSQRPFARGPSAWQRVADHHHDTLGVSNVGSCMEAEIMV